MFEDKAIVYVHEMSHELRQRPKKRENGSLQACVKPILAQISRALLPKHPCPGTSFSCR